MKKSLLVVLAVVLVAVVSIAVWKSSDNGSRRQGALESREAVALSWRGDWSSETEYAAGNVVSYRGASYVAEGEGLGTPEAECSRVRLGAARERDDQALRLAAPRPRP